MEVREEIIPIGIKRSGAKLKKFAGVTIHNTGNHDKGANADAHARFIKNTYNSEGVAGFHYAVDEKEAINVIPEDEIAEHSGKREGNDTTVSIEICDNEDGNIKTATDNGAQLAAEILLRHGEKKAIWKKNIFQHNDWSGKNCPEDIRAGKPYDWTTFVKKVNDIIQPNQTTKPAAAAPTFHISQLLKKGMVEPKDADEIKAIQRNLKSLGLYTGTIDGKFGSLTRNAVFAFQRAYKITKDGKVGEETTTTLGGVWDGK